MAQQGRIESRNIERSLENRVGSNNCHQSARKDKEQVSQEIEDTTWECVIKDKTNVVRDRERGHRP